MPDERFRFNETMKKGCALSCAVSRATKNRQGNLPICAKIVLGGGPFRFQKGLKVTNLSRVAIWRMPSRVTYM